MPGYSRIGKILFIVYVAALAIFVVGMVIATSHPPITLALMHFVH